ncbi:ribulose-phosphate 3-epimerase [Cyclobacterium qasimii]|uniref:Ribulose-phosphate 3-epimerase n=2 Tax=Cyclobacterium qasimii TaxID=1350429 RepID=S7WMH5_9BACT|nr:ribulose-phosphate 3-epimerase [Cyclobacterium qasimii]EPR65408.1 Ribulose-phosphate 3-epimerase [Cyclobacterium qasimii M12-11B]GEO20122.1 ribulose-phosphate 3-epimerase [Cyclobacterium qasimii]
MNPLIAPSILAADFANLQKEVEMINNSVADLIHVDIMDGVFVPNISFGLPVVEAVNRHAKKPLDVHLMIVEPDKYLEAFHKAGAAQITVHIEACPHLHRTIQAIKAMDCKAGVALNPHTPVRSLQDIIREVDTVLIMSVNPGFGGQEFIENTYKKIQALSQLIVETGSHAKIEIDGGVSLSNAKKLLDAGANVLVAGNFVFSSENPTETINKLKFIV